MECDVYWSPRAEFRIVPIGRMAGSSDDQQGDMLLQVAFVCRVADQLRASAKARCTNDGSGFPADPTERTTGREMALGSYGVFL